MSDVSAVVLTLGEPHTQRALASLRRQTAPPAAIAVVEGITPFSHALRTGAARVRTEFFIQVDADMVLDATCVVDLRAAMAPHVAAVVGWLRDPLLGRVSGIKLYRTSCFTRVPYPDSIADDVDFFEGLHRQGWVRLCALCYAGSRDAWHTFGEHAPDYTPLYTFWRYGLLAARYRYQRKSMALRSLLRRLQASPHPAAPIAFMAAAHGALSGYTASVAQPYPVSVDFERMQRFLAARADTRTVLAPPSKDSNPREVFTTFYRLGVEFGRAGAPATFRRCVPDLSQHRTLAAFVATVALCRGVLAADYVEAAADADFAALAPLLKS